MTHHNSDSANYKLKLWENDHFEANANAQHAKHAEINLR